MKRYLITILMVLVIGIVIGRWTMMSWDEPETSTIDWDDPPIDVVLPDIYQLQRIVGAEVDGKICDGWLVEGHSETGDKWTEYAGNQMLDKYFTVSGKPE